MQNDACTIDFDIDYYEKVTALGGYGIRSCGGEGGCTVVDKRNTDLEKIVINPILF